MSFLAWRVLSLATSPNPGCVVVQPPPNRHLTVPQGVSDNLMMGNLCPLGTGSFDLLLDEDALKDAFDVTVRPRRGENAAAHP